MVKQTLRYRSFWKSVDIQIIRKKVLRSKYIRIFTMNWKWEKFDKTDSKIFSHYQNGITRERCYIFLEWIDNVLKQSGILMTHI